LKILICENKQKLDPPLKKTARELDPHSWKPRALELQPCS